MTSFCALVLSVGGLPAADSIGNPTPGLWGTWGPFLLAAAGLTLVMMSTVRRIRRARSAPAIDVREQFAELSRRGGAGRRADDVLKELDELSREVIGRLDTRFAKLEAVIRDADRRIEELSRRLRESRGEPAVNVTAGNDAEPGVAAARPDHSPMDIRSEVQRLHDAGRSPVEIADTVGRPLGEVELQIALRRVKGAAAASDPSR